MNLKEQILAGRELGKAARQKQDLSLYGEDKDAGFVYIIRLGENLYKVGRTRRMTERLAQHRQRLGYPNQELVAFFYCDNAAVREKELHAYLREYRHDSDPGREIFRAPDAQMSCYKNLDYVPNDDDPNAWQDIYFGDESLAFDEAPNPSEQPPQAS